MSSWNEFCKNVKKTATRAADKIGQTVDIATLQVKLSTAENKLDEAYATLGRLAYSRSLEKKVSEEEWNKVMDAVTNRIKACEELKAQITNAKDTQQ